MVESDSAERRLEYRYGRGALIVSLLSAFALAVLGYHPYAEDGGLYVAGIKKLLDPGLYPVYTEFVLAPTRFSPYAPTIAMLAHIAPLPWVLLALFCASAWATLFAGWMLAARCFSSHTARCGAVALLACWLSLPIAGTSLMLMDPYVTARSISTPLALAAVAWAMDALDGSRSGAWMCAAALMLAMVHPLMAGYALLAVVALSVVGSPNGQLRRWGPLVLCALALAMASAVQAIAPVESAAYVTAARTRYYWFPVEWHWYEQFGLIAPMALIYLLVKANPSQRARWMGHTGILVGTVAMAVALIFARAGMATHLVARMQPLRCFQMVYEVMILLLGGWLGERWLARSAWRWALLLATLGGVMFVVQRRTYLASEHFELPWRAPRNVWSQAFLWVSRNTPRDALFALDARYITQPDEDAQGFRAIAERSAVPDYSKDGGEVSIAPLLANDWAAGVKAQNGLERISNAERIARLKPLGVAWVVLHVGTATRWSCPYANAAVKVCRVR